MAGGDLPLVVTDAFAADSKEAYDIYRRQGLRPEIDDERGIPNHCHCRWVVARRRSVGHRNSGIAFGHANWNIVVQGDGIDYLEDGWFLDLVTDQAEAVQTNPLSAGLSITRHWAADCGKDIFAVIASGGLSTLYFPKTDTMRGNTGDPTLLPRAPVPTWWIWSRSSSCPSAWRRRPLMRATGR